MISWSGVKVFEFNCPSKWSILDNVESQAQNPQNILLAATLLKLARDEFGQGLVKNDAETVARLSTLLERWSLIENNKIKMEPGFESFWLAAIALERACNISLPKKQVPESVIRLRANGKRCMKNWLVPAKVKASSFPDSLIEETRTRLESARKWAAGQTKPELSSRNASSPSAPLVVINKDEGEGRFALLDKTLQESEFWETLEKALSASGKSKNDFRIVVKSNISMLGRRADDGVYTDPLLVRHFFLRLAERGFTNLAVVDAQNLYGGYYLNRGVGVISAHAGYLGYYQDKPERESKVFLDDGREQSFTIIDLTDEMVEHDFGGDLGKHPLGRTWTEADFRISFSKAKTHLHEFYTVGVKNVYGALPLQDKPVEYHGKMLSERLTAAMLRDFPAQFSIVDAYLTADGFYGAAWQVRPCVTKTIIASSSIIGTDATAAMMMKYDPFESAFFSRAVMVLGLMPFIIKGGFSFFPGWRKVPRIQPFVSHNLEKYLHSPSEVSGALFTQGTDKIFPLNHPKAVKTLRIILFSTYFVRAIFDPGLASLYLRNAWLRLRASFKKDALPLFNRFEPVREAMLELSIDERKQLISILSQSNSKPAPTQITCAHADEIFWRSKAYPFQTMRSTGILCAVELLRGIDQGLYSQAELAKELEYWKNFE